MGQNYTVRTKINKPAKEVFNAVVSKSSIIKYFTDGTSGDLVQGERIIWNWDDWGEHPVLVKTVKPHSLIELILNSKDWKKTESDNYDVTVSMEFSSLDDSNTMLSISEAGWKTDTSDGLKGSYENCGGWQHMALCLKAFLEHSLDLRE